jgi:hypothetical protein
LNEVRDTSQEAISMLDPGDRDTTFGFETQVSVDDSSRVTIPLTALGALVGGLVAFVATGILIEALIVLVGAFVGWAVGLGAALLLDNRRRERARGRRSRDDLSEEAQRLDVAGRSNMTKDELAEAVADARGR